MMKGRPVLGVVSGFFFGVFAGASLFLWGVIDFHSSWLWILPLVGIVLGLAMAAWAPFGGDSEQTSASDSADTQAPAAPPPPSPPPPDVTSGDTGSDENE
jgi:hypothetical protein